MNLLSGTIKQIDSETLPQAAQLANGIVSNAATLIDGMLTNAEACVGDAIADLDGMADRKLATLEKILLPINQIVSGGLHLTGTIGGIPVDLTLKVNAQ
jgi:hypothetical protein